MKSPDSPTDLPEVLHIWFDAANQKDRKAMLACFSSDASVRDEGQDLVGAAAIQAWIEETGQRYQPSYEVLQVATRDGITIVTSRVSGPFPGSPVELDFHFTLRDGKISRLAIS